MEMVHFVYVLIVCDLFWFFFSLWQTYADRTIWNLVQLNIRKTKQAEDEERKTWQESELNGRR